MTRAISEQSEPNYAQTSFKTDIDNQSIIYLTNTIRLDNDSPAQYSRNHILKQVYLLLPFPLQSEQPSDLYTLYERAMFDWQQKLSHTTHK